MYRYTLTRTCDTLAGTGRVAWVMLNPSTADDHVDDPTIRRVIRFSQDAGFAELVVVNLFAIRATDPLLLRDFVASGVDIHGPENHRAIADAVASSRRVVFAWGAAAPNALRSVVAATAAQVVSVCRAAGLEPMCLGVTEGGHPRHPLFVPARQPLVLFPPIPEATP